jgi:hypothetical protein
MHGLDVAGNSSGPHVATYRRMCLPPLLEYKCTFIPCHQGQRITHGRTSSCQPTLFGKQTRSCHSQRCHSLVAPRQQLRTPHCAHRRCVEVCETHAIPARVTASMHEHAAANPFKGCLVDIYENSCYSCTPHRTACTALEIAAHPFPAVYKSNLSRRSAQAGSQLVTCVMHPMHCRALTCVHAQLNMHTTI